MVFKIALILKEHFREKINSYMPNKPDDVIFDFFPYKTIQDIQDIFLSIKNQYDGFYVSGLIPLQAIKILGEKSKDAIIAHSSVNVENVYQALLHHIITSGIENVNLSRVGMDFLDDKKTLEDLIREEKFAQAAYTYEKRWSSLQSVEEIELEELRVQDFYEKQYMEGRLDIIITYYYSVLERLKDKNIRCYYVYRGEWAFWNSIEELKKSIFIKKFNKNRSAVIHINTEKAREMYKDKYELFRLELVRVVIQFNQRYFNKAIFKANYDDLELYMDYETMENLTEGFRICPLLPILIKGLDFPGSVGYGIGDNIYQARLNAINASHYGQSRMKDNTGSFLLNQNESLTFLSAGTSSETGPAFSVKAISQIADKVKLSAETVVRIAEVLNSLETEEITSMDLMNSLGISLRSANKYLSHLEEGGYASVCGKKGMGSKAVPSTFTVWISNFKVTVQPQAKRL